MTDAMHTPLPWVAEPNAYGTWFIYRAEKTLVAPTGLSYRELVCGGDNYRALSPKDAALIVTAVNERPALLARVAELKAALQPFADVADGFDADGRDMADDVGIYANTAGDFRRARAAISGASS